MMTTPSPDPSPPPFGRRLLAKARTLARQDAFVLAWLAPVWLMLGVSRLMILTLSFRRFAGLLGQRDGVAPRTPINTAAQEARARQICQTIAIAAHYAPWEANCFPQAITARLLLGLYRTPYALFMGVAPAEDGKALEAHAWVVSGPVHVTGGRSFGRFTVAGCFVGGDWATPTGKRRGGDGR